MGHEGHHHGEKRALSFFASPLHEPHPANNLPVHYQDKQPSFSSADAETAQHSTHHHDMADQPFENMDCNLHENPAYHRHAEATTSELFYDLFFVANLTSFTSIQEINDHHSLTAYIGFFCLLWLTWYQVSLYDVRFSTDSIFERVAKSIHFGVMVGFAVMGAQWHPGQPQDDLKIYKAFGLILMVSRLTLFFQYGVALFYSRKYKKTIVPLSLVMGMSLISAIIYGATVAAIPKTKYDEDDEPIQMESHVYIAWYIIGISETLVTVGVSSIWRIVSFKGTHMVQRMTLLTLIILGEGIIVICKSIAKIVKNEYLWTPAVVAQIICAVLIIYFLYMLYFDRVQEEHFGTIRQQIWSFLHFPLHTTLVLILQGVSLLIIWRQAYSAMNDLSNFWDPALTFYQTGNMQNGTIFSEYMNGDVHNFSSPGEAFARYMNQTCYWEVYNVIPKGVNAEKEKKIVKDATYAMWEAFDFVVADSSNDTALQEFNDAFQNMSSATLKTLFDTFSVTVPKNTNAGDSKTQGKADLEQTFYSYITVFDLIMNYAFVAGGLAIIFFGFLGLLSLPQSKRKASSYIRHLLVIFFGMALSLVAVIRFSSNNQISFLTSDWMIPTICLTTFFCVVFTHFRLPSRKGKAH